MAAGAVVTERGGGAGSSTGEGSESGPVPRPEPTARVLVVDDEAKALTITSDILQASGFDVDTAKDGRDALERFEPGRHDAIVTDIRMPGMSGIELVERIRERDDRVPIVIVTGYATVETATRAVAAGAFEYLLKPIDFDRLKATLRRGIDRARLTRENARLLAALGEANRKLEEQSRSLEAEVRARTRDLALQKELLESAFAAVPTGIAVVDVDGVVHTRNVAWRGLRSAGPALLEEMRREIERVAVGAERPIRGREVVVREAEAGVDWALRVSVVPLAGARVLVAADDVTEAARMEDELIQIEKLVSLGTLAGGIVHDLASPVTAIMGTAELLIEDATEAQRQDLGTIVTAAQHMRDVCGGLLEFARRARTGETALSARPEDVVERAIAFARHGKKLAKVEVLKRLEPGLPPVAISSSELLQALVNLVGNACDAMAGSAKEGGRLEISAATAAASPERGGGPVAPGRVVRISVRDDGPGIPEKIRESLFAPFFTTKAAGKGTGLGLYTTRRVLKRWGGRIDFETGPEGTTFTIEVPVA